MFDAVVVIRAFLQTTIFLLVVEHPISLGAREMRTHVLSAALAAAALVVATAATSQAAVVYQETFGYYDGGTGASGQTPYFGYDWDSQATPGGVITDIGAAIATTSGAISFGGPNGNHNGSQGVNITTPSIIGTPSQSATAGPIYYTAAQAANRSAANDATALKYGLGYNNVADNTVLDYTKEYNTYSSGDALNTTNHPGLTFSWFEGNNDNTGGYSLAVEVNNKWYVTTKVYNNESVAAIASGTTGLENGGFENNVPYVSTGWDVLNFNGDYSFTPDAQGLGTTDTLATVLSRGTTGQTLDTTQNIQAFGLFSDADTASSNRRFDAFTITDSLAAATPEPASLGLLGVGSLMMLRRRKA
jgi:hypothetical protein